MRLETHQRTACLLCMYFVRNGVIGGRLWSGLFRLPLHAENFSSLSHGICEDIQHRDSVLPSDAGVGDADTIFETTLSFLGDLLVAC